MDRINIHDVDQETGARRLLGWFDEDAITERISEARDWNGNNHVGRCSGLQTSRQELMRTAQGRWVMRTDARREFDGPLTYVFVTDAQAKDWMLINDEDDLAERFFGAQGQEQVPIDVLGEQRQQAKTSLEEITSKLRAAVVELVSSGRMTEAEAARRARIDRMTVRAWVGK